MTDPEENFGIFEKLKLIEPLTEELRKRENEAVKLMRNDLHSDQLNTGLHKRLKFNLKQKSLKSYDSRLSVGFDALAKSGEIVL